MSVENVELEEIDPNSFTHILERRGLTPFIQFFFNEGQSRERFDNTVDMELEINNYLVVEGQIYMGIMDLKDFEEKLRRELKDEKKLGEIIKEGYEQLDRFLELSRNIYKRDDLQGLKDNELIEILKNWTDEIHNTVPLFNLVVFVEKILEDKLKEDLENFLPDRDEESIDNLIKNLIFPSKDSEPTKAAMQLTSIAAEIKENPELKELFRKESPQEVFEKLNKGNQDLLKKISSYREKYGWMGMDYFLGEPTSVEEIITDLKGLISHRDPTDRLDEIRKEKRRTRERFEEKADELGIERELLSLIEDMQELHSLRQHRADVIFKSGYFIKPLLEEIGKRIGLEYNELLFLSHEEIIAIMRRKDKLNREIIEGRREGFACLLVDGKTDIWSGEDLKHLKKHLGEFEFEEDKVLEGNTAFPGTHRGKVAMVYTTNDLSKIDGGEVLVSPMTNPNFISAILKASAIVTDEGGVLSHAAIVSRELKIPCIIGTKKATKVLEDGDIVEVNGEEGIVKKLNEGE